jgi:hypothetical protein
MLSCFHRQNNEGGRLMQETTMEDRRKELQSLLDKFEAHPERDWTEERRRAQVLREMIASEATARG